jgi:hypothetical protein
MASSRTEIDGINSGPPGIPGGPFLHSENKERAQLVEKGFAFFNGLRDGAAEPRHLFECVKKPRRVFAAAAAKEIKSVFCRDMCVAENTSRPANVRNGRYWRTLCALQRGAILPLEKALPFSTGSAAPSFYICFCYSG